MTHTIAFKFFYLSSSLTTANGQGSGTCRKSCSRIDASSSLPLDSPDSVPHFISSILLACQSPFAGVKRRSQNSGKTIPRRYLVRPFRCPQNESYRPPKSILTLNTHPKKNTQHHISTTDTSPLTDIHAQTPPAVSSSHCPPLPVPTTLPNGPCAASDGEGGTTTILATPNQH